MTEERKKLLREELKKIEDKKGRLTAEAVVVYARANPRSALYGCFTWDLKKAAEAYWLDQARALIRSVEVTIETEDRGVVRVALYKRDPEMDSMVQGYRSIYNIREEPEPSRQLLVMEMTAAEAHLEKARDIAAVVGHKAETQKALKATQTQRKRIEASITSTR